MSRYDVLIVGGGHGGAQAAAALRQRGYEGTVAIVSAEAEPPYERPPLSKEYLLGDKPFERMLIRPPAFWADRQVDLLLGRTVVAVETTTRTATLEDGAVIEFGDLVWAGGGRPRRLTCSGHDLAGVHTLRSRSDVDRIRQEVMTASDVVIIGGGYIGLEAAAALNKLGKRVRLLEAADRVLARVAGPSLSRFYEAEHRSRGVEIRLGTVVDCIDEANGRAVGVGLSGGERLAADLVMVGIGIEPQVGPLLDAGALGGNGVLVDELCRTSLPGVYAIGDCAAHPSAFAGDAPIRIESVQNAVDQATVAAKAIIGKVEPYRAVPWFWSNQYDLKLQTVGLSTGYDLEIVRGVPASRSFSVAYLKLGRVVAFDCVNRPRDFVEGRKLVEEGTTCDPLLLADPNTPLKTVRAA